MYEVIVENEGARGLVAVKRFQPDLILLDLLMADMEGSEVASRIRTDATIKNIPIVFLTASITKEESFSGDGEDIGGHSFMAKPVSVGELINCIESNLKRQ